MLMEVELLCFTEEKEALLDVRYHLPSLRVLLFMFYLGFNSLDCGGFVIAAHDPVSQDGCTLDALRCIVDFLVVGADLFDGNASDLRCLLSSDFEISCVVVHVYLLFCLCSYCILKN